jgi:N-methylhydantoinase B
VNVQEATARAATDNRSIEVDPVSFEIIKNKLSHVVDEGITALKNCSGTAITSEMQDLCVGLYRPDGGLLAVGLGFLHHVTAAMRAVGYIVEHYSENPGIAEDDIWFHNDEYVGAIHAPDAYVISPIHWQGELTGWVATFVHIADIGAISPGGFSPNAKSSFDEGFMSKGIKIAEGGVLRDDIIDTILNHSRDPGMLMLDLKSQMAANYTAKVRLLALFEEYGFEQVDAVRLQLIDQSEELMRKRLAEIPDGTWRARTHYDIPGDVRHIELTATKQGGDLTFDCEGTSPQSPLPINCAYHAAWGGSIAPVFPLLAWDLFWNEGILKPIEFKAPEGSLVNAIRPAPLSLATIATTQAMNTLAMEVIAKMLGSTEKYKDRPTATWAGAYLHWHYAGLNPDNEYVVAGTTDSIALAGGARAFRDGVTTGGDIANPALRTANTETHEVQFPMRTLYRRAVPDSGGPGKYRGGVSQEVGLVQHGIPDHEWEFVVMPGRGTLAPLAHGVAGGYPGCTNAVKIFRDGNVADLPFDLDSTRGDMEDAVMGDFMLDENDIFYGRWTGGGGYGDPIDRDPALVLKDVTQGLVTDEPALEIYGVVIDDARTAVDEEATHAKRVAIREARLGRGLEVDTTARHEIESSGQRFNEYLQLADDGVQCTWCGGHICAAGERWKDHASVGMERPSASGPLRPDDGDFHLRCFYCPTCATQLEVEVIYTDDEPIHDQIERWHG